MRAMTICEYAVSKRERIINSKKSIEEMEINIKSRIVL